MRYIFLALIGLSSFIADAQNVPVTQVRKAMTLKMARTTGDEMPGTRGASVAWHPVQKKYYAGMAGNIGYPLSVFDAMGKRVSHDSSDAEVDLRGLWYNPDRKTIYGNSYDIGGWFRYDLTTTGMIREVQYLTEEMTQPNPQCVGAFNPQTKDVLFLHDGEVSFYDQEEEVQGAVLRIHWGRTKTEGPDPAATLAETPATYNYTTVVYTGIKGAELGFLKPTTQEIELYNIKTGFLSRVIKLPADAAIYESFNFAFCNGMYWIYNIETREWTGYK